MLITESENRRIFDILTARGVASSKSPTSPATRDAYIRSTCTHQIVRQPPGPQRKEPSMKVIIIGGVAEGAIAPSRPDVHLPIANTLRNCPKGWMRALEGVDDAARRIGGPLDRRGLHE